MKLTYSKSGANYNSYEITLSCSKTDSKTDKKYRFYVSPDKIEQTIMELEALKHQFSVFRAPRRTMFNQINYFIPDAQFFSWLKDYPFDDSNKQNYGLTDYNVCYFDARGVKFNLKIQELEPFLNAYYEINTTHKIGEPEVWQDANAFQYTQYSKAVRSLISSYVLSDKLLDKPNMPSNKI